MDEMATLKKGATRARWDRAIREESFDLIRHRKLIETTAEHFLAVPKAGGVSTTCFCAASTILRSICTGCPGRFCPKPNWPTVRHKERRAITWEEHQKIIQRELNPATRAYYELLWHLGGAQSDIVNLTAEDIDWKGRTISYRRQLENPPQRRPVVSGAGAN